MTTPNREVVLYEIDEAIEAMRLVYKMVESVEIKYGVEEDARDILYHLIIRAALSTDATPEMVLRMFLREMEIKDE